MARRSLCEETVVRAVGVRTPVKRMVRYEPCDHPLNDKGQCYNAANHVEDEDEDEE